MMDTIAPLIPIITVLAGLTGLWKWISGKLDSDRKRLDALELERDTRLSAMESRLQLRDAEVINLIRAIAHAEATLSSVRHDLERAIKALNSERGKPCRNCGRGGKRIASLDEITEEML